MVLKILIFILSLWTNLSSCIQMLTFLKYLLSVKTGSVVSTVITLD